MALRAFADRKMSTAAALILVLMSVIASASDPARAQASEKSADWTNPFLGPGFAQWLVGAIGEIASEQERAAFLALQDDAEAESFVEDFWSRGERPTLRAIYEERAAEADRQFSEGAYPGRRTDRGTIFILYGPADEVSYEEFRDVEDPDVELWRYSKKSAPGLNGKKPGRNYRFAKQGEFIRFFRKGGPSDPAVRRRRLPESLRPPPPGAATLETPRAHLSSPPSLG